MMSTMVTVLVKVGAVVFTDSRNESITLTWDKIGDHLVILLEED